MAVNVNKMLEVIPGDVAQRIKRSFALMKVAEEEIAAAIKKTPRCRTRLNDVFRVAYPGDLIAYGETLYRAHVRELLGRVRKNESFTPGTDAECLAALSAASLKAPLDATASAAMAKVFASCFPEKTDLAEDVGREPYKGAVDEMLATLRRQIGQRAGRD